MTDVEWQDAIDAFCGKRWQVLCNPIPDEQAIPEPPKEEAT